MIGSASRLTDLIREKPPIHKTSFNPLLLNIPKCPNYWGLNHLSKVFLALRVQKYQNTNAG